MIEYLNRINQLEKNMHIKLIDRWKSDKVETQRCFDFRTKEKWGIFIYLVKTLIPFFPLQLVQLVAMIDYCWLVWTEFKWFHVFYLKGFAAVWFGNQYNQKHWLGDKYHCKELIFGNIWSFCLFNSRFCTSNGSQSARYTSIYCYE